MAARRKHIDKAVRSKLKDYREEAPADVWEGIAGHLDQTRRKGRMFWITRVAAAAAVVIVAGSTWLLMRNGGDEPVRPEAQESVQAVTEQGLSGDRAGEREPAAGEEPAANEKEPAVQTEMAVHQADRHLLAEEATDRESETGPGSREARRIDITGVEARYLAGLDDEKGPAGEAYRLRELTIYPYNRQEDRQEGIVLFDESGEEESAAGRWALGTQVSPVYSYRDLGGSSSMGGLFSRKDAAAVTSNSNSTYNAVESGMMAYSGGLHLNYLPSGRLSLQSGLYYSRMGLAVDHAYLSPSYRAGAGLEETLKYNSITNSSGTIEYSEAIAAAASEFSYTTNWSPASGATDYSNQPVYDQLNVQVNQARVEQQFEYLEVPLIIKYRMVDRRLGLNLLGGMATNFLIGSDAYFIENGNRDLIGETTGIRTVNYSSLLGFGMDYRLSGKFRLDVEPFFKYYLNSINLSSSLVSRPYSLGVYTGISYLF